MSQVSEEIKAKEEGDRPARERRTEEQPAAAEKAAGKRKRTIAILLSILLACAAVGILLTTVVIPNQKYHAAVELYTAGRYEDAIAAFTALEGYRDSAAQIGKCETAIRDREYEAAVELYTAGKYEDAIAAFTALEGYRDSAAQIGKCETGIKDREYAAAAALCDAGKYEEAYKAFCSMNYKDSSEKASECLFLKQKSGLTDAAVGSTVKFGFYEQDNDLSNGKEEIEWLVLDADGGRVLVLSKYALDCQPYNSTQEFMTWEECSLRTWLNDTFFQEAFDAFHQALILRSTVTADANPVFETPPGNDTSDKVFLLSTPEVIRYFPSKSDCQCRGTEYCYAQGTFKAANGNCYWWLRTPGLNRVAASFVRFEGSYINLGYVIINSNFAVRPAMWIDPGA